MRHINYLTSALATLTAAAALVGTPDSAAAQQASTQYACYVPGSGTMYRIKESNTPAKCGAGHPEFAVGTKVPYNGGSATLPTNAAGAYDFSNYNGFVAAGPTNFGAIPATGPGNRIMWYPAKSAFRAGLVNSFQWDADQIGFASMGLGQDARAAGANSVALGQNTFAYGANSAALGTNLTAAGDKSIAMGSAASTAQKTGAFVYGDASTPVYVVAAANNQFAVRAQHFWFGKSNAVTATAGRFIETTTGAYLSNGGVWVSSSDVARKHLFEKVDGEAVLVKLGTLPVSTWSYRVESDSVRHMGPTAQDFHSAFGLGDTDKGIGSVDVAGVSLAGIKALIERTDALQRENDQLRAAVAEVLQRIESLESAQR